MSFETHAPMESITDCLAADHVRIDAHFADARRLAADGKLLDAATAFDDFTRALRGHILVEEELLFPVLESKLRMLGPTDVMRHEHRAIDALIDQAAAALGRADALGFSAVAGQLATLLGLHNRKEERVLYPRSDAALDPSDRDALVRRLEHR